MKKNNLRKMMLSTLFTFILFNASPADDKTSGQSPTATAGTYKTETIHVGLEYTIKYKRPSKSDPADMAYEFFELNKEFFQIKNPREELVPKYRNDRVVSFQQTYHGIGLPSGIKVRFSRDGELNSVEGNYIYDINLPTTPSIDSASAVKIALQNMGNPPKARVEGPEGLGIVSPRSFYGHGPDNLYLVWTLKVFPRDNVNTLIHWIYYVNALDGSILHKQKDYGVFIRPNPE